MLDETATLAGAGAEGTACIREDRPARSLRLWQAATALLLLTTIGVPVVYLPGRARPWSRGL